MSAPRPVRAELRKLTTTRLPWGFLGATALLSGLVLLAILVGSQAEGPGSFPIDTAEIQGQLLAFGPNALLLGGLLGGVAAAREYGHGTAVPMYLVTPRRGRAMTAQLLALLVAGGVLGLVGGAIAVGAGALSLPLADQALLLGGDELVRLVVAAGAGGGAGALLGAGVGSMLRNTGGTVTIVVLLLLVVPPIVAQVSDAVAPWVPAALIATLSGVADDTGTVAAVLALLAWGLVPTVAGVLVVRQRDVV
jgi:ABC-2 type transport system permease protein